MRVCVCVCAQKKKSCATGTPNTKVRFIFIHIVQRISVEFIDKRLCGFFHRLTTGFVSYTNVGYGYSFCLLKLYETPIFCFVSTFLFIYLFILFLNLLATVGGGAWNYFSAVCWMYGRRLHDLLKVPIGLISSAYGGSAIEAWSSPDALSKCNITT